MSELKRKTNAELAKKKNCTSRQISKSRRKGWIWVREEVPEDVPLEEYKKPEATKRRFESSRFFRKKYTAPLLRHP